MKLSTALSIARRRTGLYKQGTQWVGWVIAVDRDGRKTEYLDQPTGYFVARARRAERVRQIAACLMEKAAERIP